MVLADEINRTPPKTQAAAARGDAGTPRDAGDQTYELPEPFFRPATQNPIEQEARTRYPRRS